MGGLKGLGQREHLPPSVGAAGSAQDRHTRGRVQDISGCFQLGVSRSNDWGRSANRGNRVRPLNWVEQDIARNDQDGDVLVFKGGPQGDVQRKRQLLRRTDELAICAGFSKQFLRVRLLEIVSADFL